MNFKRLSLTDIKIDIKRIPKKKDLIQAMEAAGWYKFSRRNCYFIGSISFCSSVCFLVEQMLRTDGRRVLGAEN